MMPTEPEPPTTTTADLPGSLPGIQPEFRWYHKMSAVLFVTFCLEIGFFLVIFPWTPYWDTNYFYNLMPQWQIYWDNLYVRGAISGLGVVNLYISFVEAMGLRRFAR